MRKEQLKHIQRRSASSSILQEEEEEEEDSHQLNNKDDLRVKREAFRNLKQESETSLDFDDLLPHVGEFGRYQKLLVFLVCLPACIPCGIHAFSQLFMAPVPPHWCRVGDAALREAAAILVLQQENPDNLVPDAANVPYMDVSSDWLRKVQEGEANDSASYHLGSWKTSTKISVSKSAFEDISAARSIRKETVTDSETLIDIKLEDTNDHSTIDTHKQIHGSSKSKMILPEIDDSSSNVMDMNHVIMAISTHKTRHSHTHAADTDNVGEFDSTNKLVNVDVTSITNNNRSDATEKHLNLSPLDVRNNPSRIPFQDKRPVAVGGEAIRIKEEDGHRDRQHEDDDIQVTSIMASIRALAQDLERTLVGRYPETTDSLFEQNSSDATTISETESNRNLELKELPPQEGYQKMKDISDGVMSGSIELVPSTTIVRSAEDSPNEEYEEWYTLPLLTLPSRDGDDEDSPKTIGMKHTTGTFSMQEGDGKKSSANTKIKLLDGDRPRLTLVHETLAADRPRLTLVHETLAGDRPRLTLVHETLAGDPDRLSLVLGNVRPSQITDHDVSSSMARLRGSTESLTLAAFEAINEDPHVVDGHSTRVDGDGGRGNSTRLDGDGERGNSTRLDGDGERGNSTLLDGDGERGNSTFLDWETKSGNSTRLDRDGESGSSTRLDLETESGNSARLDGEGESKKGAGHLIKGKGRKKMPKKQEGEKVVKISRGELNLKVEELLRDIFIPIEGAGYSCCQMYDVNTSFVLARGDWQQKSDWPTKDCDAGWHYDTSVIFSSIVIDFELVCSRAIYPTVALAVLNIGGIIGVYVFGTLSDRFGRRFSFLACLGLEQVSALVTAFAPSYQLWLACRFLVGLTIPAIYQIPFIISMELVGPNYRSFVTVLTCLFYVAGMILLSGTAYLVRNWQHLCIVTSLPFFSYVIYWWFLPESPRWLLGRGRLQEASAILQTMARVNGAQLPDTFQQKIKFRMMAQQAASRQSGGNGGGAGPPQQQGGFCGLWATPNMRCKTLLIILVWFANETVYVGLSYYGPAMGENEYLSFFLACVVEIPSYLLCWAIMDRCGRRWLLGVSMILGGICSIATVLMPKDADTLSLSFYLIAKFSESAAFLIIYPFSAELFPTVVRGVGIGFAAYVGGLGLVVIPFINYLGSEMLSLPLVIMGVLSVMGGIAAFRLPETLHQPLPNTLQEGEQFGADFTWSSCWSCLPPENTDRDSNGDLEHQVSKRYRDEIIDLTALNEISFDDGGNATDQRNTCKDDYFSSEGSDYMTENEYSVNEDYVNNSDDDANDHPNKRRLTSRERTRSDLRRMNSSSCEAEDVGPLQTQGFAGRGHRSTDRKLRMSAFSSGRSQTLDTPACDDHSSQSSKSGQLASALEDIDRRRAVRRHSTSMKSKIQKSVGEEEGASTSRGRKLREDTPLQRKASSKRGKLVKQASIVPIITDSSGAMKMTFWM